MLVSGYSVSHMNNSNHIMAVCTESRNICTIIIGIINERI